jgi:hypothetical protein
MLKDSVEVPAIPIGRQQADGRASEAFVDVCPGCSGICRLL